jgi:ribosomal protein S18 acetylase RimI-like enzyme
MVIYNVVGILTLLDIIGHKKIKPTLNVINLSTKEIRMNDLNIKKASLTELLQLQEISRQTFIETFAEQNTAEDMQKYLDDNFNRDKLTQELNNSNSEFYFATFDDKVIGYLKLNYAQAQTEFKDNNSIEIERIYVLKEFHGKKVGQILYTKALNIAKHKNSEYIWLGVWEKNQRAINFYRKNGFEEFDKHIFKLGNDEQTDILMRLKFC